MVWFFLLFKNTPFSLHSSFHHGQNTSSCRLNVFLKPITKGEILAYLLRFIKMGEASFFRVSELASPDAAVNRFFVRQCGEVPRRRISHD
jgi:hypothetical protein